MRRGELVAFPTETVYGLGADALNERAVARIFEVKGRPSTSPVIVHIGNHQMVERVAASWSEAARILAEQFWPGPLTLVVPKSGVVPDIVTAGLPTVGIRMPAHPVALALLEAAQIPVAAPSANRFTQLSPTNAEHVRRGLGDAVDFLLDGGPCQVGIESTVLSLAGDTPALLRPGGISRKQIEELIGPVRSAAASPEGPHASPGMHPRHYSPRTRLILVPNGETPSSGRGCYLQLRTSAAMAAEKTIVMPSEAAEYAARLYHVLHALDDGTYDWIAVETPPATGEWEAVLDRLRRAAASVG